MPAAEIALAVGSVVGGYLLGTIPFGLIVTRWGGAGDIRQIGSGNIGATNVLRTGRRDLALITVIGDGGKGAVAGFIAFFIAYYAFSTAPAEFDVAMAALAGGAAFVGHLFPVWLKFKGGKGVATFFGVLLALAWPVGLAAGATWILVAVLMRYSSLAALTAALLAPAYAVFMKEPRPIVALAIFMAVLIYIRHHQNIRRLIKGEEPKIGAKKEPEAA